MRPDPYVPIILLCYVVLLLTYEITVLPLDTSPVFQLVELGGTGAYPI